MSEKSPKLDPLYVDARREAIWIVVIFSVFAVASLTTSLTLGWDKLTRNGYQKNEYVMNILFGMPLWVFWGVFVPWVLACLISIWFAFFVMKDGSLEDENEDKCVDDKTEHDA